MRRAVVCYWIGALAVGLCFASALTAQQVDWRPTEPMAGSDDWLRLGSGEWLRGEMRVLRDDVLEFESKELDDLKIDWDDVAELRSARVLTYTFSKRGVVVGTAVMRDSVIVIRAEQAERAYPRSDLLTIIEGRPTEWNYWSLKLSLGFIGRLGNTDQQDLNSIVLLRRTAPRTRLFVDYQGNYSQTNDVRTVTNHRVTITFDYILTRNFFITPFAGEYYTSIGSRISTPAGRSVPAPACFSRARAVSSGGFS